MGIKYETDCITEIGWIFQGAGANLQIFGAVENSGKTRWCLSADVSADISKGRTYNFHSSNATNFVDMFYPIDANIQVGDEEKIRLEKKVENDVKKIKVTDLIHDKSIISNPVVEYTMTRNLYLLGQNYNTGYRGSGLKQITMFKYWDKDGNLIRDMVPCYRRSDGEIGMYDRVSQTLFTNAGSGIFTKGPSV